MSHDLSNRIIDLSPIERERLAAWLSQLEPAGDIHPWRWTQLADGETSYLTHIELSHLMDDAQPCGLALDIIRGHAEVSVEVSLIE